MRFAQIASLVKLVNPLTGVSEPLSLYKPGKPIPFIETAADLCWKSLP